MKRHTQTVQVLAAIEGTRDRHGNRQRTWGRPRTRSGCVIVPRGDSSEPAQPGRTQVIVGLTLYLPNPDDPVTAYDRVVWDGKTYEVEGEPGRWRRNVFTGRRGWCEVALKRVEG